MSTRSEPLTSPAVQTPTAPKFTGLDLALIINMMLWGGNFVVSKSATELLAPLAYNALRFSAATFALFTVLRFRKLDLRLPRHEWRSVLCASLVGYTLYQPAFINGVHLTTVGNSVLILTAGPVWVVLFNALRSQEKVTRGTILGVLIALTGVLTVIVGRYAGQIAIDSTTLKGDALMLVASLLWAWSLLLSRGPLSRNPSVITTFWLMIVGTFTQIVIGVPSLIATHWSAITGSIIGAILYSGVISVTVGSLIFNYAIGKIGTARTAIYSYLQPIVAAGLAIIVLHEAFTPWLIVGGALIFAGVSLVRRT